MRPERLAIVGYWSLNPLKLAGIGMVGIGRSCCSEVP
jgi:hypothetical protein